jgi:hypothetical protein
MCNEGNLYLKKYKITKWKKKETNLIKRDGFKYKKIYPFSATKVVLKSFTRWAYYLTTLSIDTKLGEKMSKTIFWAFFVNLCWTIKKKLIKILKYTSILIRHFALTGTKGRDDRKKCRVTHTCVRLYMKMCSRK